MVARVPRVVARVVARVPMMVAIWLPRVLLCGC